jgi:hypothetical protein
MSNTSSSFKHTAESDARIRQGYAREERVSAIARALGVSRNVVIGRANRIGLSEAGRQSRSPFTGKQTPAGKARALEKLKAFHRDHERHSAWIQSMRASLRQIWADMPTDRRTERLEAMAEGRRRYWAARKAQRQSEAA